MLLSKILFVGRFFVGRFFVGRFFVGRCRMSDLQASSGQNPGEKSIPIPGKSSSCYSGSRTSKDGKKTNEASQNWEF
jgi:hypothetical protein